jgi:hypothetical protein
VDDDSVFGPIKLNIPLHVDDISSAVLDGVLSGDIDHGLGDMDNLNIEDYGGPEPNSDDPTLCSPLDTSVSLILPASKHGSLAYLFMSPVYFLYMYISFSYLFIFFFF